MENVDEEKQYPFREWMNEWMNVFSAKYNKQNLKQKRYTVCLSLFRTL